MADDFRDFVKFDGFAGQAWYHQMIRDKRILRRAREFTPERLFKSGEQGVWYDPSDTTTLFQDSAGTTPVTASGQPVGRMLDKSGRGNHATQPTAASRPIYRRGDSRGVVNQLLNTETLATQSRTVTAVGRTLSFTGTGSITLSGASTAGPLVGTGVNDRVSLTFTPTAGSLTLTVSGSVTKGQLNLGPTALPYQRNDSHLGGVATGASTDLHWLETDGVDDGMVTGNINFTATDKMSVFAGVNALNLAPSTIGMLVNHNGTGFNAMSMQLPSASNSVAIVSLGSTASAIAQESGLPATLRAVIHGAASLTPGGATLRRDGSIRASATSAAGGFYANAPLTIGRQSNVAQRYFNGWLYSLIIRGALTSDADVVATERHVAKKTGVVIP